MASKALVVVLIVAIAIPVFFPEFSQRLLFDVIIGIKKLELHYIRGYNQTVPSLSGKAFEEVIRAANMPTRNKEYAPDATGAAELRAMVAGYSILFPLVPGVRIEAVNVSRGDLPPVRGYWFIAPGLQDGPKDTSPVLIYLHGGGYVAGGYQGYSGFSSELAARLKGRTFLVDYTLAPERVLPWQLDEVTAVYKWMLHSQKIDARRISIAGDSAGGGLTLSTILAILQEKDLTSLAPPASAVTFTAYTDLWTNPEGRPSFKKNLEDDLVITASAMKAAAQLASNTSLQEYEKRKNPKLSPIYANLEGLKLFPPLLMFAATCDVLEDDTMHFADKAKQSNLRVTVEVGERMQHVWPLFYRYIDEAETALDKAIKFISKHNLAPQQL